MKSIIKQFSIAFGRRTMEYASQGRGLTIALIKPKLKYVFIGFILTLPINIFIQYYFPEINYFLRAFFSIIIGLTISFVFNIKSFISHNKLIVFGTKNIRNFGLIILISLITIHIIFH